MKKYAAILIISLFIVGAVGLVMAVVGPDPGTEESMRQQAEAESASSSSSSSGSSSGGGGGSSSSSGGGTGGAGSSGLSPMLTSENAKNVTCSNLTTVRERIRCRIRLAAANEINYLPEECRAMAGDERARCIEDYKKVQTCWSLRGTRDRVACVREKFGLLGNLSQEKISCDEKIDSEKTACLNNLRAKAYGIIKFRLYNLEERAESLMDKGLISEELAVNFITALELKKVEFNEATSLAARKKVLEDVKVLWEAFRQEAMKQIAEKEATA